MSTLAQAENKTRKKQGASGGGGDGGAAGAGGGGGGDQPAALAEEARRRYLNYALSVITSRALPDVRDGLKPVQRRILFGMWNDLNLSHDAKYKKCAQVVGAIMGPYHPHGDASIYEALVRMAQDFSLRYPLVDGHGNFGSLDGDSAAAYRYTECRLERLAGELLDELSQKTVDFRPNYDGTRTEPIVLPARLPHLLMNGTTGIAVGMATNIPPHHLGELCDALVALVEDPNLTTKQLLKWVKGPDFPTGGEILNDQKELQEIYETGQGSVRLRGEYELEDLKRGGQQIIVTSIPYAVNKSTLVAKIGEIVRERKLPLVVDVRDESTKEVRIVLELKKEASPELVMAYLYKNTPLQTNFNVNLTCLVPNPDNPDVGMPRRLGLKDVLQYFLQFRMEVTRRRLQFQLEELKKRVHLLEGFEKVYDALDEMIRIIRQSEGKQDAAKKLIARFKLDEAQTDAILEMKLYKLARLEILVVQNELKEKRAQIKGLEALLKSDARLWGTIKTELGELKAQYATGKRRTKVSRSGAEEMVFDAEALIADEDAHVVITRDGWIKRLREVKDPSSTRLREGDAVMAVVAGSLKANLVLFSNFGTAYVTRFNDVPASTGYGDPVQKLFKFDDGERVVSAFSLDTRLWRPEKLLAVTRQGQGMRVLMALHLEVSTRAGRRYAKTGEGDEIVGVQAVEDKDVVGVLTERTSVLVCKVGEVNELAGPGKGVSVIKLEAGDRVMDFLVSPPGNREAGLAFETGKGRSLVLHPGKHEVTGRGGKGHEMSRKDTVKEVQRAPLFIPLPEPK
ncbi:DNA gyrase/topoisomerase IV subunit A [Archangium primigenium]|uniref:DNA gyrase/topoisomerase IV subunit A n=1 Tax=[Archangium] primigenium TaxID=2792470 RepID=UPI00195675AE|nr:DNA topoisomerase IV subunit A [Archangium primigenium]MBM7114728.1 DNA topoisomerase IV subunit A [Archangium primigenium]